MNWGDWIVFQVSGPDVISFFNRRSSQLISKDNLKNGVIAHFLRPEGKITHTFGMMRDPEGKTLIELHANTFASFKADLEKHIFSEDISVGAPRPYRFTKDASVRTPSIIFRSLGLHYDFSNSHPAFPTQNLNAERVRAKIPIFPLDYNEQFSALDADVIEAIHFSKGCYPGQEVISKSVHIGKPPFALFWFHGPIETMAKIADQTKGKITSQYPIDNQDYGFIRLRRKLDIKAISKEYGVQIQTHCFSQTLPK